MHSSADDRTALTDSGLDPAPAVTTPVDVAAAAFRRPPQLSLSGAIAILCLAVLTPPLLLTGYLLTSWTEAQTEGEVRRLQELATDLRLSVDRELDAHITVATMLGNSRTLRNEDFSAFRQQAEDFAAGLDGHFILTGPSLRYLLTTRGSAQEDPGNPVDLQGLRQVLEHSRPVVSDLITRPDGTRMFSVRVPVVVDGLVQYVLSYVPDNATLQEILLEAYRPDGWNAAIVDGRGRILARSRLYEEFFGASMHAEYWHAMTAQSHGLLETIDLEGRPSMTAFEASGLSGWYVLVWAPEDVVEAPAQMLRQALVLLSMLTLGTSILAAYGTAWLLRLPVQRLVKAAAALGAGKPVEYAPAILKEANLVGDALERASKQIAAREAELVRNDERLQILMNEMSHRSKNLLSVINAMIAQTGRRSSDFASFYERLSQRMSALARSQDLMVQNRWDKVDLRDLARAQLEAFVDVDRRVMLKGPPMALLPPAAQAIGMAFHELATNSVKYGAISAPEGTLTIAWQSPTPKDPEFRVTWEECGGPPVNPPEHVGFGTVVVEKATASSLGGTARIEWRRHGLFWELRAAASFLAD